MNIHYFHNRWVLPKKTPSWYQIQGWRYRISGSWRLNINFTWWNVVMKFHPQNKPFFIIPLSSRVIGLRITMWLETIKEILGAWCCWWMLPSCLVFWLLMDLRVETATVLLWDLRWSQHTKEDRVKHAEKWIQSSAVSFLEQFYFQTSCLGDNKCSHYSNQKELRVSFPYSQRHLIQYIS